VPLRLSLPLLLLLAGVVAAQGHVTTGQFGVRASL
jgi:hypothetical protein